MLRLRPQIRLRSLGSRLLCGVLCTALISLSSTSYLFYGVLVESAQSEIQSQLHTQTILVQKELLQTEVYTVALSDTVKEMKKIGVTDLDSYRSLVFRLFQHRPALAMSVYFGQAPFQIVPNLQGFLPYFYPDQKDSKVIGELLSSPHQDVRYSDLHQDDSYLSQDYYKVPVEARAGVWMEPFDWHGITMTSFITPFYDSQETLLGISGTDVNVTAINEWLNHPVVNQQGYFVLLTEDGNLLSYPPDTTLAKNRVKATDIPTLQSIWAEVREKDSGLVRIDNTYWAYQRLDSTGWMMMAAVPKWAVVGRILLITLSSVLGVGGLLTVVVVAFVRDLNSRLQPLVLECQKLIASDAQRTRRLNPAEERIEASTPLRSADVEGDELDILSQSFLQMSEQLQQSFSALEASNEQTNAALTQVKASQVQLIQSEKMAALGELVAGIAHEINNPVNFIHGNINHVDTYIQDLLKVIKAYQEHHVQSPEEIEMLLEDIEFDFVSEDLTKLLKSMKVGTQRIRQIVLSLRNFSRLDEADFKAVDLHEGLDSSLLILQHRLKATSDGTAIEVVKDYGQLPLVECYAGQLNQVFVNLMSNAIDSLEDRHTHQTNTTGRTIWVSTQMIDDSVQIAVADNGHGMSETVRDRIFNPFFTTKPVGKGTGLGLSISYQIITEKHHGTISCDSTPGEGTKFVIRLPIQQFHDSLHTSTSGS